MSEPMTALELEVSIRELWEDYCEAANPNGSMGDIDLYDIDEMFEAAQGMYAALVAMQARLAAAEKMAGALGNLLEIRAVWTDPHNDSAAAKARAAHAAWEAAR
jgi:hypothetical protein